MYQAPYQVLLQKLFHLLISLTPNFLISKMGINKISPLAQSGLKEMNKEVTAWDINVLLPSAHLLPFSFPDGKLLEGRHSSV